jgi:hypothetical protein
LVQKAQGGERQKSKKIKFFISLKKKHLSISTPVAISPFRTKNAGSPPYTEGQIKCPKKEGCHPSKRGGGSLTTEEGAKN